MAQILLVGDEKDRTSGVKEILTSDGHRVALARDIARWREEEKAASPEVIVAAVGATDGVLSVPMGGARGFAPPILFVHRETDEAREPQLKERMVDQVASPFEASELLGRVDALIRVRRVVMHQSRGTVGPDLAEASGWRRVMSSVFGGRKPRPEKPAAPYLEVAARVADWSDRRDGFEPGHAERVTSFAAMIADSFGLPDGETAALLRAAMLHDIGKVAVPIEVLRHKGPLEENQMRIMRTHAERGATILRALDRDDVVAETIFHHHESMDGSGYNGRKGAAIPRAARILAVAESFDAMTTSIVRRKMTADAALGLMRERRGDQWDAECVDALVGSLMPRPRSFTLS
jgi:putative nucleotidyltransferase with HDIG domain